MYLRLTVICFLPVAIPRSFLVLQLYVPLVAVVAVDITKTRYVLLFMCITSPFSFHSNLSGGGLPSALHVNFKVSPAITSALGSAVITAREGLSVKE